MRSLTAEAKMTHYRPKPPGDVEAVPWSGSNWHEMLAFAGRENVSTDGKSLFLRAAVVPEGWWIVRDQTGALSLSDPKSFDEEYEEVTD